MLNFNCVLKKRLVVNQGYILSFKIRKKTLIMTTGGGG